MLTFAKSLTTYSTASLDKEGNPQTPTNKGRKGRLEIWAEANEDNRYKVRFEDFGGYGRERWQAEIGDLGASDITSMISQLEALLDATIDSTRNEYQEPEAQETEVQAEPADEIEAASAEDVPAEAIEAAETDMDQLEA